MAQAPLAVGALVGARHQDDADEQKQQQDAEAEQRKPVGVLQRAQVARRAQRTDLQRRRVAKRGEIENGGGGQRLVERGREQRDDRLHVDQ